jgi:F420H(2)-dependent quinone reductase
MKRLVLRTMSALHNGLYRASKGKVGGEMRGAPVLLLTTTGRKSGKKRTTPLLYGRTGDDLVVIASVGGAPKNPAWYWNLQGQDAEVQVRGERRRVRARDAEGEERERLWQLMLGLYPPYAEYQTKTTRQIPVVVLETV